MALDEPARAPSHGFVHDMRTPLTVIRMQTPLLLRRAQAGQIEAGQFVPAQERIDHQTGVIESCLKQAERDGR